MTQKKNELEIFFGECKNRLETAYDLLAKTNPELSEECAHVTWRIEQIFLDTTRRNHEILAALQSIAETEIPRFEQSAQ